MIYCFGCLSCGKQREVIRPMKDYDLPVVCNCGSKMLRNYRSEHSAVRGDYNHPIESESLAFDSIDAGEHRKRFPDVDLKIEGRIARPILRNLGQKRRYLKGRGWVDQNSF